ncbi:MAG: O-antigen ligase family protein [Pseudomonadota bacterium]
MSAVLSTAVQGAQKNEGINRSFLFLLSVYLFFVLVRPQDYPATVLDFPLLPTIEAVVFITWLFSRPSFATPMHMAMWAMMAWIPINLYFANSPDLGSTTQYFLFSIFLTFLFVATASREDQGVRRLAKVMVLSTSVIALHGLDQYYGGTGVGFSGQSWLERREASGSFFQIRYVGIFADPNDTGMILVMALPWLFLYRAQSSAVVGRFAALFSIGLHLWAIYLTNSRGTYVALAASLGMYLAIRYNMVRALIATSVVAPLVLLLGPARIFVSGDQSTQDRIDAWYQGFQLFNWHPINGVGMNHFMDHHHKAAHNSWVQLLAEQGTVGYAAWAAVLFSSLFIAYRLQEAESWPNELASETVANRRQLARTTLVSMVGCLTAMFFLSRAYHLPVYLMCAFVAGQYLFYRTKAPALNGVISATLAGGVLSVLALYIIVRLQT